MTNSHREIRRKGLDQIFTRQKSLEMPGIDPGTSRMLSGRSTIWATPPMIICPFQVTIKLLSN